MLFLQLKISGIIPLQISDFKTLLGKLMLTKSANRKADKNSNDGIIRVNGLA